MQRRGETGQPHDRPHPVGQAFWPSGVGGCRLKGPAHPTGARMADSDAVSAPAPAHRKPYDEEIDVFAVTHPGHVRRDNQDHYLVCALRKQIVVRLTSLPDAEHIMDTERLAFLAMVADGVGGGVKGGEASRVALQAVTQYVGRSMR